MVAGMRSYLAAADVDVAYESLRQSLMMSAQQDHLIDGKWFSVDKLMHDLEAALDQALSDGYAGLWATGDMTWELGPDIGSGKLLEYEWRLERFFRSHPEMGGVCQYHIDSLPPIAVRHGICTHPRVFVSETLSMINSHFLEPDMTAAIPLDDQTVESYINYLAAAR
jgi:hypothetical protein